MNDKSKIEQYHLKGEKSMWDKLKELAPSYGHSSLASFCRWILINFINNHKD
jgi:hypothetical protein